MRKFAENKGNRIMNDKIKTIFRYFFVLLMPFVAMTMTGAPRVSLLTVGPGNQMYQLEGHSALRIITDDGDDWVVNWGIFDFNSPNFAYRFVKGETDYSIGITRMSYFLADYSHSGRYVVEQPLYLSAIEAEEVKRLVDINLLPENRKYRYNYLRDNCATRPLAIIEKALSADGAHLEILMDDEPTTIREEMRRYHAEFPKYQMFIDFALGSGIDKEATIRERAFAPLFLEELVANSNIVSSDGTPRPLAGKATTLLHAKFDTPTESGIPATIIISIIFISAILVTLRDLKKGTVSKWYDAIFYSIIGISGIVLVFLVFISEHEATSPNINLMWVNPLSLLIPLIIWFKKCKYIVFYYQIINFALIFVWLIGQPLFTQSTNWLFIPIVGSEMLRSANYIYLNYKCRNHIKG